ncbi:AzlC family ABC transporter permease [Nocardia sp. NEAU-G5]|uniref:AzlC family ABC transporter permease n=1 Tax=Nocardia albiluteola TaxID=2842303 RepID=A0ABS6B0G9_9NOCA|nr:AzlC family ABC transporter permease [Nocardia albiluteola]
MRSIWRTLDRGDLTGIATVCLAVGVTGASYGATAVTSGLPAWLPIVLSVLVLAGGSEFLFVGIVAAGGGLAPAVLAGLLVNARHLPYGLSLPDVLGTGWRRLIGTHVMNDESVALAMGESDPTRSRAAYWMCGLGVLLAWPLGALLGVGIGTAVPNPAKFGLDAIFPAILIALALPALRQPDTRRAALAGAAAAAAAAPFLPAGLPVLLALPAAYVALTAGDVIGRLRDRRRRSSRDNDASAQPETSGMPAVQRVQTEASVASLSTAGGSSTRHRPSTQCGPSPRRESSTERRVSTQCVPSTQHGPSTPHESSTDDGRIRESATPHAVLTVRSGTGEVAS